MNARDILNNADPQELRNLIKHLKPGRSAVSTIIINQAPNQYPQQPASLVFDPMCLALTDANGHLITNVRLGYSLVGFAPGSQISTGTAAGTVSGGVQITGLTIGRWYAIEGAAGPWHAGPTPPINADYFSFALSLDGSSWSGFIGWSGAFGSLDPGFRLELPEFCVYAEAVSSNYGRVYFKASTTSVWFRCADNFFVDNTGSLGFKLMNAIVGEDAITLDGIEYVIAKLPGAISQAALLTSPANEDRVVLFDASGAVVATITWSALLAAVAADSATGATAKNATIHVDGRLATVTNVGGRYIADGKQSIQAIYITCDDPGSAGSTIVDINRIAPDGNTSSIFVTSANRPTLVYNDADGVAKSGVPDITYLDENYVLTIDIDQVGTHAEGLSVTISTGPEDPLNMTYMRSVLIDEVWSGHGLPTAGIDGITAGVSDPLPTSASNLSTVDRLTINMDNNAGTFVMSSQPYVWHPSTSNGRLAIVHPGHAPTFEQDGVGNTIRALIDDGFTVVGFAMPSGATTTAHDAYPSPTGSLNYLKFFVEPIVRLINAWQSDYPEIYMTGLSGGAWTTVLASAIDARIDRSVQVSGSLPLYSLGNDWEQQLPGVYPTLGYIDLYLLAADKPGRRQIQTLTVNDAIFNQAQYNAGPDYAAGSAADAAALGGYWELIWDSTHTDHVISAYVLGIIETEFNA